MAKTEIREDIGKLKLPELTPQQKCEAKGGFWDAARGVCILVDPKEKAPETAPGKFDPERGGFVTEEGQLFPTADPEFRPSAVTDTQKTFNPDGTVTITRGGITETLTKEEHDVLLGRGGQLTEKVKSIQQAPSQQQLAGQRLAGQVGDIQPSTGITPTGLDVGEALTQGVVGSIPSAIRLAGSFAVGAAAIGAVATAPAGGIGAVPAAVIGGAVGFIAGIVGGMTSNMKGQRTDDTNAQQRVLDEGKQTLKDWSTMAKADPANREFYLSQFNLQLQLIQDAHVQMITDTNADVAKFESAVPNLAEFNSFYSVGGERDALVEDMVISLQTPVSVDYSMLELTQRRSK